MKKMEDIDRLPEEIANDSAYWGVLDQLQDYSPDLVRCWLDDGGVNHLQNKLVDEYHKVNRRIATLMRQNICYVDALSEVMFRLVESDMEYEQAELTEDELDRINEYREFYYD